MAESSAIRPLLHSPEMSFRLKRGRPRKLLELRAGRFRPRAFTQFLPNSRPVTISSWRRRHRALRLASKVDSIVTRRLASLFVGGGGEHGGIVVAKRWSYRLRASCPTAFNERRSRLVSSGRPAATWWKTDSLQMKGEEVGPVRHKCDA